MGPAFSEQEHRERLERARDNLRQAGLDGCVCVAPEHLYYVGGYDAHTHFSEQGLVFTANIDEPTLVIRDVDLPLATETSWVKDVRTYHYGADNPSEIIADIVEEKGLLGGNIGTDLQSYALPASYYMKLNAALGNSTIEDSSNIVGRARLL